VVHPLAHQQHAAKKQLKQYLVKLRNSHPLEKHHFKLFMKFLNLNVIN